METPAAPLIRYGHGTLTRTPGAGYVGTFEMHNMTWTADIAPDYRFRLYHADMGEHDPLRMEVRLEKWDWGYGGDDNLGGFPYRVAAFWRKPSFEIEVWSEPPMQGQPEPWLDALVERNAKLLGAG